MSTRSLLAPISQFFFPPNPSSIFERRELLMSEADLKEELSSIIDDEQTRWEALVADVDPDRMEEPGVCGDWSFRDIAAHLYAWRDGGTRLLEAAARGEPEPLQPWPAELQTDDEINAWLHNRDLGKPLDDVLDDYAETFRRLKAAVNALPERALIDPQYFLWMDGDSVASSMLNRTWFDHLHVEHEPQIREWLEGN